MQFAQPDASTRCVRQQIDVNDAARPAGVRVFVPNRTDILACAPFDRRVPTRALKVCARRFRFMLVCVCRHMLRPYSRAYTVVVDNNCSLPHMTNACCCGRLMTDRQHYRKPKCRRENEVFMNYSRTRGVMKINCDYPLLQTTPSLKHHRNNHTRDQSSFGGAVGCVGMPLAVVYTKQTVGVYACQVTKSSHF